MRLTAFATLCVVVAGDSDTALGAHGRYLWIAFPWDETCINGPHISFQTREVKCVDAQNSDPVDDDLCSVTDKPCGFMTCACATMACVQSSESFEPPCLDEPEDCRSEAACADLVVTTSVWGFPAKGVDVSAYTGGDLTFIGCGANGCSVSSFFCNDLPSGGISFGSDVGPLRARLGSGEGTLDCCNATNPHGVCNAMDKLPDIEKLCNQLGYGRGYIDENIPYNFCPEVNYDATAMKWTSDWVQSDGYGKQFRCELATYKVGEQGGQYCPTKYVPITDRSECEIAATNLQYVFDTNHLGWAWRRPAGCFRHVPNGRVYFNPWKGGVYYPSDQRVCSLAPPVAGVIESPVTKEGVAAASPDAGAPAKVPAGAPAKAAPAASGAVAAEAPPVAGVIGSPVAKAGVAAASPDAGAPAKVPAEAAAKAAPAASGAVAAEATSESPAFIAIQDGTDRSASLDPYVTIPVAGITLGSLTPTIPIYGGAVPRRLDCDDCPTALRRHGQQEQTTDSPNASDTEQHLTASRLRRTLRR